MVENMLKFFFEGPPPEKILFENLTPFEKFRSCGKEEARPGGDASKKILPQII